MHNESDGFERLQRLLVLKKYEKPPPRYFEDFSDKVIARIRAAEELRARPWWERLGLDFSLKPAFAGALGLMLSAAVVGGMLFADPGSASGDATQMVMHPDGFDPVDGSRPSTIRMEEIPSSTAPVASGLAGATPFSHMALSAQRVNWVMR